MTEEDVLGAVDAELEAEADMRAEDEADMRAMSESFHAMTTCKCCLVGSIIGRRSGLCEQCEPIVFRIRIERRAAEVVNGQTRRELAAAYVDRVDAR
jgi:hypothetical protein